MKLSIPFSVFLLLLNLHLLGVAAKCCRPDVGGDCGDNSAGTPCCGYKKCDGLCCNCPGVVVIREVVEADNVEWTSWITAPWDPVTGWTYWTCRASHITTWYPPPTTATKRDLPSSTATTPGSTGATETTPCLTSVAESAAAYTHTTLSTAPSPPVNRKQTLADLVELQQTFDTISNGSTAITLDQYLGFFNATPDDTTSGYGLKVVKKFRSHDVNGDGVLSFEEVQLVCDEDGCD